MASESKPIELGAACVDFQLPGTDGKIYSQESFKDSKVLVVAFTCNHCPYVQPYESRLNDLAKLFRSKKVSVVCINANDAQAYPDDSFQNMQKRARQLDFAFHYLRDETQDVARAFNAACTPEFYVYDASRKLRYHGRLDDNQKSPEAVKHRYLKDAIEALLADGAPEINQTTAIGCSIKWKAAS